MSSSEWPGDEEASLRPSQRPVYVGLIQANTRWEETLSHHSDCSSWSIPAQSSQLSFSPLCKFLWFFDHKYVQDPCCRVESALASGWSKCFWLDQSPWKPIHEACLFCPFMSASLGHHYLDLLKFDYLKHDTALQVHQWPTKPWCWSSFTLPFAGTASPQLPAVNARRWRYRSDVQMQHPVCRGAECRKQPNTAGLSVVMQVRREWLNTRLLLFSCQVISDPLWPRVLQHTRLPCPFTISWSWLRLISIENFDFSLLKKLKSRYHENTHNHFSNHTFCFSHWPHQSDCPMVPEMNHGLPSWLSW